MTIGYLLKVGDKTTCGGVILTGDPIFKILGVQAATLNSIVSCGKHSGQFRIIGGVSHINTGTGNVAGTLDSSSSCPCYSQFIHSPANPKYRKKVNIQQYSRESMQNLFPVTQEEFDQSYALFLQEGNQNNIPHINLSEARKLSILRNTAAIFDIRENSNTDSSEPWYESDFFDETDENISVFNEIAFMVGIDPDLIKAIAYMESTHGYYDRINPNNKSFRPMNINYEEWEKLCSDLGYSKEDVKNNIKANVHVGAILLKRIQDRIKNPTVEKIASIYNVLGRELTNDYGARVKVIYENKLWENN